MPLWEPSAHPGHVAGDPRSLARLAAQQHGVFTRCQTLACGFAPTTIDRRVAQGTWHRGHAVRGGEKKDVREVIGQVEEMIDEGPVLLRIEHLQHG